MPIRTACSGRARPAGVAAKRLLVGALAAIACVAAAAPAAAQTPPPPSTVDIDAVFQSLTPQERLGQVIMVNFIGADAGPSTTVASLIRDYKVGTVLISASNGNVVNRASYDCASGVPYRSTPPATRRM